MLSILALVLPVFALILAGWLARRVGILGPAATSELSRFVVWLALPALLFDIIANADWAEIWRPGFVAAFGLGAAAVFAVTVVLRLRGPRPLADSAIDGLNGAYPNTGYMGFPLLAAVLGEAAMPLTLIATVITVCVVFAAAIVLAEIGLQAETRPHRLIGKVALSLARNPLVAAPVLGAAFPLAGFAVPAPAQSFLTLLGGAASPCALVALGLFLGEKRASGAGTHGGTALLVGLKLLAQPAITWVLAALVFRLPPFAVHAAVLLAALPTGTGPFMLAEFYGREADVTSRTILISTILSLITIAAYLGVAL